MEETVIVEPVVVETPMVETKKNCITKRKRVKKDGTIVIAEYNQSEYNKTCYEKNKERYATMTECGCGKEYNIYTKSNHHKTAYHKLYEKMLPPVTAVAPIEIAVESTTFQYKPPPTNYGFPIFDNDGVIISYCNA